MHEQGLKSMTITLRIHRKNTCLGQLNWYQ